MAGENAAMEAADLLTEICERADALGIGLVAMPVPEVREVLAALRRRAIASHKDTDHA